MERSCPTWKCPAASGREVILCGDWNIAHREIDLKNWKSNQKNSGFLPEERAWITARIRPSWAGSTSTASCYPEATGEAYTWWSNRGQAWAKNVGWRIDYQIATPGIALVCPIPPEAGDHAGGGGPDRRGHHPAGA
jgi:exodeoxyribonuclease-3